LLVSIANQRISALNVNRITPSKRRMFTQEFVSVNVTNPMNIMMEMYVDPATNVTFAKSEDPTNVSLARSVLKSAPLRIP
jgi:hypothetical protein